MEMLLRDGKEFLLMESQLPLSLLLYRHMECPWWDEKSVRWFIQSGQNPANRTPKSSTLHLAIGSSYNVTLGEVKRVLILLISNGADIFAKDDCGRSVSDLACDRRTLYREEPKFDKRYYNDDLQLKDAWMDALTECGFNAEEVISKSLTIDSDAS